MYITHYLIVFAILGVSNGDLEPEGAASATPCPADKLFTEEIDGFQQTYCCTADCEKQKEFDEILGYCGLDANGCCPTRKNKDQSPFCPGLKRRLSPARASDKYYWPHGYIPYEIESTLPNQERILYAIQHYKDNTVNIRLGPRNGESDYVRFVEHESSCNSLVGRSGGQQIINVPDWCQTGSLIHEIGHALGLKHTHVRHDRDDYIDINWDNIPIDWERNYNKAPAYYDDCLKYDYGSIMHYGENLKGKKVITTLSGSGDIGQRNGLSVIDKGCMDSLYSPCRVALFQFDNFAGDEYSPYGSGEYTLQKLTSLEFKNQAVSSMKVTAEADTKCTVKLFDLGDFTGWQATVLADNSASSSETTFSYTKAQLEALNFVDNDLSGMKISHEIFLKDVSLSGTNLKQCQGDCDSDAHCIGLLKCYQRNTGGPIPPGCSGTAFSFWDYCYNPYNNILTNINSGGSVRGLIECQGDCDSDSDCLGDLKCFKRNTGGPTPPGCIGTPFSFWDYCYNPYNNILTDIDSGGKNLIECQGDCDYDSDCLGDLKCFQRNTGGPIPPGCVGTAFSYWDYCYDASYSVPLFDFTNRRFIDVNGYYLDVLAVVVVVMVLVNIYWVYRCAKNRVEYKIVSVQDSDTEIDF